ncbi:MAG: peptidase M14, partial [Bacteroidota bacterium]
MKIHLYILLLLCSCQAPAASQRARQLYDQYEQYKENSIRQKRFKHADIVPLIQQREGNPLYKVIKAGTSVEGRAIYMLRLGTGKIKVLLWS